MKQYYGERREAGGRPEFPRAAGAEKDTYRMKQKNIRKRRKLSPEKKFSILEELKHNPDSKAEILRREGLYSTDIQRFEEVAREGAIKALSRSRPGKKRQYEVPIEQYESLKKELERKEQALAEFAVEFTILKKKVNGE
jgi:transposase